MKGCLSIALSLSGRVRVPLPSTAYKQNLFFFSVQKIKLFYFHFISVSLGFSFLLVVFINTAINCPFCLLFPSSLIDPISLQSCLFLIPPRTLWRGRNALAPVTPIIVRIPAKQLTGSSSEISRPIPATQTRLFMLLHGKRLFCKELIFPESFAITLR